MEDLQKLKYPIGQFECPKEITEKIVENWIEVLELLPNRLTNLAENFSDEQLETRYRPGGWTVRQVIHHLADSHHHSYTRLKWALTENGPLIKVYNEKEWSNLNDAITAPISISLLYLEALHTKLVFLLKRLTKQELEQYYLHPDGNIKVTVAEHIGKYAWHSKHHFAHVENLAKKRGW